MNISRQTLIFLLISLALITLPHSQHLPAPLFGFFCLLWSWRFIGIFRASWLPGKLLIFAVTLAALALLYHQHQGVFGRDAGTAIFVTALGLKLLEIRSERDIYLITFLAFIVAATEFLYQQSMFMAVYILLVCCSLLGTLVSINLKTPHTLAALKTSTLIIAQSFPIAILIFLVFPRIEAPRWMWLEDNSKGLTGLSDTLEPGAISQLGLSDELVFRVKFTGDIPPPVERYWRGPVFTFTDGKSWRESRKQSRPVAAIRPIYQGKAYQYKLLMEPQPHNWVYALEMPVEYTAPLKMTAAYQLVTTKKPEERAEYQLTSYTRYTLNSVNSSELDENLQLPHEPSDRLVRLVRQLGGFNHPPEYLIKNLFRYFRQNDFYYTLTPPLMPHKPIETFLFDARAGFCSHYATAFVYLLRIAGIPARVIGGYQGGEINAVGGFLEVRQANAHAWAEVWLKNKGWTRFDPTTAVAPERVEQNVNIEQQISNGAISFIPSAQLQNSLSWLKQARQLWSSLDYKWQRWVINYSTDTQTGIFDLFGIQDWRKLFYGLFILIAVFILILFQIMIKKTTRQSDPAVKLYRKFCKKIPKTPIKTGEAPADYARRCQKLYPGQRKQIETITRLFINIHYQPDPDKQALMELKKQVRQFKLRTKRD